MELTTTQPVYVLPKQKARAIIPKILTLVTLGTIFYGGVLLNISLLELTESQQITIRLIAGVLITALVGIGVLHAVLRARKPYFFYQDQMLTGNNSIPYKMIISIQRKETVSDKIFKTYSLVINNQFKIKYIPQQVNLQEYIEKMVRYASGTMGMNERI